MPPRRKPQLIPEIWETRFHRQDLNTGDIPTKDWIFYLTRPGLEFMRRPDSEGKTAYELVREEVRSFLASEGTSASEQLKLSTKTSRGGSGVYCTLIYPFDISSEIPGKRGIAIHVGSSKDAHTAEDRIGISYPTMFDQKLTRELPPNPPGVSDVDPMWKEFASAKILPTDQLLGWETSNQQQELLWGKFRYLLNHQFIEIRLLPDNVDGKVSSREQIAALQEFQSSPSGYTHFAGAPGTGKSTLLHMVSAHRLFMNGMYRDETDHQNILYYVPSLMLKEEAEREIRTILQHVYRRSIEDSNNLMTRIHFVYQEDLYLFDEPDRDFNLLSDIESQKGLWPVMGIKGRPSEPQKKELNTFKRYVRQVIFGIFENQTKFNQFLDVMNKGHKSPEDAWNKSFSLHHPGRPAHRHSFNMEYFLPWGERDKFRKRLREIRLITEAKKLDETYWDPTSMLLLSEQQANKDLHSFAQNNPDSIWHDLRGKMHYIVIDEAQDINISEIRLLLRNFSTRREDQPYDEFNLIGAGDENQNIKQLLFSPQNQHIEALFNDYLLDLKTKVSTDKIQLSNDLENRQSTVLVAAYRIFDEMVEHIQQLLNEIFENSPLSKDPRSAPSKIEQTIFGRKGVFLIEPDAEHEWVNSVLETLGKQLEDNADELSNTKAPVIVALSFDKDDLDPSGLKPDANPLSLRLAAMEQQTELHAQLNALLTRYTQKFLKKYPEGQLKDWEADLSFRGVMSVKDIKGLTVPISIILSPKALNLEKKSQRNIDLLSKFLVQMTRSQYMTILPENVGRRYNQFVYTTINEENITPWLDNILQNSSGLNNTLASEFKRTLNHYDSDVYWERLENASKELDPLLKNYVSWLRSLYEALLNNELMKRINEFFSLDYEPTPENPKTITPKKIKFGSNDLRTFAELSNIEQDLMLGERMSKPQIASMLLFACINDYLRAGDIESPLKHIGAYMDNWMKAVEDDRSATTNRTRQWFELVTGTYDKNTNERYNQLVNLFSSKKSNKIYRQLPDDWTWPRIQSPRLTMGSWTFRKTDRSENDPSDAWMRDASNFFTVPKEVLLKAVKITQHTENSHVPHLLRMQFGLTSFDATLFCKGFTDLVTTHPEDTLIQSSTTEGSKEFPFFEWFVSLINDHYPKAKQEGDDKALDDFHAAVIQKIEAYCETETTPLNKLLNEYLNSARSMNEFERILTAFPFEDWSASLGLQAEDILLNNLKINDAYIRDALNLDQLIEDEKRLLRDIQGNEVDLERAQNEYFRLDENTTISASEQRFKEKQVFSRIDNLRTTLQNNELELAEKKRQVEQVTSRIRSLHARNPSQPDQTNPFHESSTGDFFRRELATKDGNETASRGAVLFNTLDRLRDILASDTIVNVIMNTSPALDLCPLDDGQEPNESLKEHLDNFYSFYVVHDLEEKQVHQLITTLSTAEDLNEKQLQSLIDFLTTMQRLNPQQDEGVMQKIWMKLNQNSVKLLEPILANCTGSLPAGKLHNIYWDLAYGLVTEDDFTASTLNKGTWNQAMPKQNPQMRAVKSNLLEHTNYVGDDERLGILHRPFVPQNQGWYQQPQFSTVATLKAYSYLHQEQTEDAIDSFREAGLLSHAGALELCALRIEHQQSGDGIVIGNTSFVDTIRELLEHEVELQLNLLSTSIFSERQQATVRESLALWANRYFLSTELYEKTMRRGKTSVFERFMMPNLKVKEMSNSRKSPREEELVLKQGARKKSGSEAQKMLLTYMEHHEHLMNLKAFGSKLEDILNDGSGDISKDIQAIDTTEFTVFRTPQQPGATHTWLWDSHVQGYVYKGTKHPDPLVSELKAFVLKVINEGLMEANPKDFVASIQSLTKTGQPLKEYMLNLILPPEHGETEVTSAGDAMSNELTEEELESIFEVFEQAKYAQRFDQSCLEELEDLREDLVEKGRAYKRRKIERLDAYDRLDELDKQTLQMLFKTCGIK